MAWRESQKETSFLPPEFSLCHALLDCVSLPFSRISPFRLSFFCSLWMYVPHLHQPLSFSLLESLSYHLSLYVSVLLSSLSSLSSSTISSNRPPLVHHLSSRNFLVSHFSKYRQHLDGTHRNWRTRTSWITSPLHPIPMNRANHDVVVVFCSFTFGTSIKCIIKETVQPTYWQRMVIRFY